jgi:hypothetical protein
MSGDVPIEGEQHERGGWAAASFFTPRVCAVTAFTLAVVALTGQNVVSLATSSLLEFGLGEGNLAFYFGWGLATAIQAAIVVFLARRTFESTGRWEEPLGRAAVLIVGLALVAAMLAAIAGAINEARGF